MRGRGCELFLGGTHRLTALLLLLNHGQTDHGLHILWGLLRLLSLWILAVVRYYVCPVVDSILCLMGCGQLQ